MRRDAVNQSSLPQFASEVKQAGTPAAARRGGGRQTTARPGLARPGLAHRGQFEVNRLPTVTDLPPAAGIRVALCA